MSKAITFTMIFTGTVLSVFVLNLAMFALVPDYHDAIMSVVSSQDIPIIDAGNEADYIAAPVMTGNGTDYNASQLITGTAEEFKATNTAAGEDRTERVLTPEDILKGYGSELTPLSASPDEMPESTQKKPAIIDKEYHEDCGTGKGYWVITYSDGTTAIE